MTEDQTSSSKDLTEVVGPLFEQTSHDHYEDLEQLKEQVLRAMRPHSKLGLHKGEYRVPKAVITEQQKGQQPFEIDGVMVWAGSLKAAIKKARKLNLQQQ